MLGHGAVDLRASRSREAPRWSLIAGAAALFAIIGIAFGMGFLIGPAISGFLAGYSYQYPIFAAAALSATSILATYFLLPSGAPTSGDALTPRKFTVLDWGNYLRYFRQPALSPLLLQFFAFALAFAMYMSGFPLFAERRYDWHGHPFGVKEVGYVYAYLGLLGVILQGGLIGKLVKIFGESNLVRAGFFFAMAGVISSTSISSPATNRRAAPAQQLFLRRRCCRAP